MKKNIYPFLAAVLLFLAGSSIDLKAQCVTGCNTNTYVNSVDPKTIEYDNMVGVFHSSMAKEFDGTLKVWGQGVTQSSGNALTPMIVNAANYGTGTNQLSGTVLKFAGGSNVNTQQFAVLTSNGLYIWGNAGVLVPTIGNIATNQFRKVTVNSKADGLPTGVSPGDVKMMFGTQNALTIVTCSGAAYMLSSTGTSYGDGAADSGANDILWHCVSTASSTPLTGVIAVRGTYQAFMALTYDSITDSYAIYTWGADTRLGNNTGTSNRSFATKMTMPGGATPVTPKMIGMTASTNGKTYYLLSTTGRVFSLGENESRQLGNSSTADSNNWVEPTASTIISSTTYKLNSNVVWISPQEHDGQFYTAAINVVTNDYKIWAWGDSSYGMLGAGGSAGSFPINPTFMPGNSSSSTGLNYADKILALETGGHTTILIKQCTNKFGYVGHKINGSMADGTNATGQVITYNFADTAVLSVCGAVTAPALTNVGVCFATDKVDLTDSEPAVLPPGVTGINWWTDVNLTIPVPDIHHVGPGTYYASFAGPIVKCGAPLSVILYAVGSPEYNANCPCYNSPNTASSGLDTKHGITLLQRAGETALSWPLIRKSAHTVLESNTKGFVITRMTTLEIQGQTTPSVIAPKITVPQDGMMVYDTDAKCLKIYTVEVLPAVSGWKCYTTPACP